MRKQKICIIGGGLTGLVAAISLSRLECDIDLITRNFRKNIISNRTLAISENSLSYLNKLNIFKHAKKEVWPCSVMKLYSQNNSQKFSKMFEINNDGKSKKILYMLKNSRLENQMMNKIKKIKSISIRNNKKIDKIYDCGNLKSLKFGNKEYKYNLIIICTGNDSNLTNNLFGNEFIKNSYKEKSITTIMNHDPLKNNIVRQIFLNHEILALLPISRNKTSIVWSVKNGLYKENDSIIKERIKYYVENFFKKIKFAEKIEYKDLNFLICQKYYKDRMLLFGDALHVTHPFAGQGFNMTIRDLESLRKTLKSKIELGLDIGTSDILSEFSEKIKPENFIYSFGIDFLKNCFSIKSENLKKLRNNIILKLSKNNIVKDIFFNLANKGFKF